MQLKLGPHHITGGSEISHWLALQPSCAVFLGDLGAAAEARPGTLTIGRVDDKGALAGQGFDMNRYVREGASPLATADLFVQFLRDAIRLNPAVQAWAGPNEQVFERDDAAEAANASVRGSYQSGRRTSMLWLAECQYQIARLLHTLGKRAALGNWPTGNPLPQHNLWPYYTQTLKAVADFDAVLTRHAYGGLLGGQLETDFDNSAFTRLGYPDLPMVITETGMDAVGWLPGSAAWRDYYHGDFERYWATLLQPLCNAMAGRRYLIGAALFSEGGAGGGWGRWDVSGTPVVARLAAWQLLPPTPVPSPLPPVPPTPPPAPTQALVGLHWRADGRGAAPDLLAATRARVGAVKLLSTAGADDITQLRAALPGVLLLTRLFADLAGRAPSPDDFVHWVLGDLALHWAAGVRLFEVANEPNLRSEGCGTAWRDGADFGVWFGQVADRLHAAYPGIQVGWPGLSPGGLVPGDPGLRAPEAQFLAQAGAVAPPQADWVGLHFYWTSPAELAGAAGAIARYRRWAGGRPLYLTEFADVTPGAPKAAKGAAYVQLYAQLVAEPDVKAAFAFVVSASSGYADSTWRAEDGTLSPIPSIVGARSPISAFPPDGSTHIVSAQVLNVRLFPWSGAVVPPMVRQVLLGTRLQVQGSYKSAGMPAGWGCISPDGNEWVSLKWLAAL